MIFKNYHFAIITGSQKKNRLNRCLKLGTQNLTTRFVAAILLTFKLFARFLIITVTDWNGQKSRRATIRNDHKLNCQQTKTTKKWKGHKPERSPTGQATNRKGHNRSDHILCRKFEKMKRNLHRVYFFKCLFCHFSHIRQSVYIDIMDHFHSFLLGFIANLQNHLIQWATYRLLDGRFKPKVSRSHRKQHLKTLEHICGVRLCMALIESCLC